LREVTSDVLVVKKISWLNNFSFYFAVYLTLYFLLVLVLTFTNSYQLQMDYVMLLITSMSLYAIGYSAMKNPEIFKALPDPEAPVSTLNVESQPVAGANRFPGLKERLLQYMETGRPYLKSDLKISELAESLSVPYHQLSELINDEFLVNFYDFINKYRVEEAKRILIDNTRNFKMLAIAYEVGFNSKATFNRVFKKFTGQTPSDFQEKYSLASQRRSVSHTQSAG
jgi:AraC-like DNA-binding protein